jgi:predicted ATPase
MRCHCRLTRHETKLVVLTGGPGAGKTAVLEVVKRNFCEHVAVLPETASILFGGGFPRRTSDPAQRAAQRAVFHVQRELEQMTIEEAQVAVALCDRGTVDGAAYWPGPGAYWDGLGISPATELSRYAAVIHLRTPPAAAYNHANPVRVESAQAAALLDERIAEAWSGHPRRFFVEPADNFLEKLGRAVALIRAEVPACCRTHRIAELGTSA